MKIKITYPIDDLQAGLVYDVPDEKALEYIAADVAVIVEEKKKKVTYGNGQNNS